MAITEALRLVIDADTRGAVQGIEKVGSTADRELSRSEKSLDRWGNRLTSVGAGFVSFGAVAAYGLHSAAQAASDLGETVSKSNTIFGSAADEVEEFADSASKIGLSKQAALDAASGFGNLFTQVGLSTGAAADMSTELTSLAADFASFHNADITEVIEAQTAAFRGEYDALQRFVPTINAAAVQQRAMADTGKESAEALTEAEKATATYALMLEGAGSALGDFERTSDSAANKQRQLAAEFENLKAGIGEAALPVLETLVGVASSGIGVFTGLNEATGGWVGQAATIGTVASLGVGGLSLLIGQAIKLRENFGTAADAISNLYGRVGGLAGIARGLVVLAPLTIGAGIALDSYNKTKQEAARITDQYVEALSKESGATKAATDAVSAAELTAGDLGSKLREAGADLGIFNDAIRDSGDAIERLDDEAGLVGTLGLTEVLERAGLAGTEFADELERVTEGMSDGEIIDLIDRLDGLSDRYSDASEEARNTAFAEGELAAQHGDSAAAVADLAGATEEATSALQDYQDKLAGTFDPLFGMISAQQGVRDAAAGVTEAQNTLNEALAGGDATEIADAQRAYDDALVGSSRALVDAQSAQAVLNDAIAAGDVSLEQAQQSLYTWAINAGFTSEQAWIMAGALGNATTEAQTLDAQNVDVPINATDHATPNIRQVDRELENLDGDEANVTIKVAYRSYGDIPGAAAALRATEFHQGGYVPGPRGQEVAAILQAGERVLSLSEVDAMSRGVPVAGRGGLMGGGSTMSVTYALTFNGPTNDEQVVEALKRYERNNGHGWRN